MKNTSTNSTNYSQHKKISKETTKVNLLLTMTLPCFRSQGAGTFSVQIKTPATQVLKPMLKDSPLKPLPQKTRRKVFLSLSLQAISTTSLVIKRDKL